MIFDTMRSLFNKPPRARATDPHTPHDAAASAATKQSMGQSAVLYVLRLYGPLTDEALLVRYAVHEQAGDVQHQSPSGIRTRRKELQLAGLVRAAGHACSRGRHGTTTAPKIWPCCSSAWG